MEYLKGVAWALQEAGYKLHGWEGVISGDVPRGAGLSSSAAIELATARAFQAVSGFPWDAAAMAKLGQRAENQWVGINCGIMDQMISAAGQAGHALLIDCRSLDRAGPSAARHRVVILDTATRRGLVDSAYNERRAQCEAAARFFGVPALRDVSVEQFEARGRRARRADVIAAPATWSPKTSAPWPRPRPCGRRRRRAGPADGRQPRQHARRLRDLQPRAQRHGRCAQQPPAAWARV